MNENSQQQRQQQEERNQLLLNAIRQKFAAGGHQEGDGCGVNETTAKIFKATQLTIPALRIPPTASSTGTTASTEKQTETTTTTPLNEFVLKHLRQNKINGLSDGFKLPQLRLPTQTGTTGAQSSQDGAGGNTATAPLPTFNIPMLKRLTNLTPEPTKNTDAAKSTSSTITGIESRIKDININANNIENNQSKPIDLTAALIKQLNINKGSLAGGNSTASAVRPSATTSSKARLNNKFDIPYIECDRKRKASGPILDEYCCLSVAQKIDDNYRPTTPTAMGQILCESNKRCRPLFSCAVTELEKRHLKLYKRADYAQNIRRFLFNTKSPDDLVKESLQKFQRVSNT